MSKDKEKILIVEDDEGIQRQLKWSFDDYEVLIAGTRAEAIELLRAEEPHVVTLDLGLPPDPDGASEGLAALDEILSLAPNTKVIMVSGNEDRQNAIEAVGKGAYDFYQKPIDQEELALIIRRAVALYQLEQENRDLKNTSSQSPLAGIVTGSDAMMKVCAMVEKVAGTEVSVLLLGASGTGKEVLARALHELSPRKNEPFVAINCAAIPENLLESELFGYEKGAFTGAVKQTLGKIEMAQGGTLFLDEIGDLPAPLQVKLLRFLQERVIERVGGRKEIPVDVRIVCATHQNLEKLIAEEQFREDLFYRLSEIVINIPPLKDRPGDAPLLAHSFLNRFNKSMGRAIKGFTSDATELLDAYGWPGNVRELENKMKRAVIMSDGKRITAEDLDLRTTEPLPVLNLKQVREEADRQAIQRALARSDGNISQAAKLLGISRPTIYDLMKQYKING